MSEIDEEEETWDDPFRYIATAPRDDRHVLIRDDDGNVAEGFW